MQPQQAESTSGEAFYRNVQTRMLNLYDAARLNAWRIYEREKVAAYWKEQLDWFDKQLQFIRTTEAKLTAIPVATPEALADTIETLTDIVEVCAAQYELHA